MIHNCVRGDNCKWWFANFRSLAVSVFHALHAQTHEHPLEADSKTFAPNKFLSLLLQSLLRWNDIWSINFSPLILKRISGEQINLIQSTNLNQLHFVKGWIASSWVPTWLATLLRWLLRCYKACYIATRVATLHLCCDGCCIQFMFKWHISFAKVCSRLDNTRVHLRIQWITIQCISCL